MQYLAVTLMMAQYGSESTWEPINYGWFMSKFRPDIIIFIRQLENIKTKYIDKSCLYCLIIYIYIYIYIYNKSYRN